MVRLKDIARRARVSVMTVSRALRDDPKVAAQTRQRIQHLAREMGYRPDPLVSALMTYRRVGRARPEARRLAFVTSCTQRNGWQMRPLHEEFHRGAVAEADRHGYGIEEFWLRDPGMNEARLTEVLRERRISGVLIGPLPEPNATLDLDWDRFAAVAFGYSLGEPPIHRVANDQFHAMHVAMQELRRRGYKRPALALTARDDHRVAHRWLGGFLAEQAFLPRAQRVTPFVVDASDWHPRPFMRWFEKAQPDVILGPHEEVVDWLGQAGVRVPEQVGFCHINLPSETGRYAGVYQNGFAIGAAAVGLVIGLLQRNEVGLPSMPYTLLVRGRWVEGPTVRELELGRNGSKPLMQRDFCD